MADSKSPRVVRIVYLHELGGVPDGTRVQLGKDDTRDRQLMRGPGEQEYFVIDDGGGSTIDENFLNEHEIYAWIVPQSYKLIRIKKMSQLWSLNDGTTILLGKNDKRERNMVKGGFGAEYFLFNGEGGSDLTQETLFEYEVFAKVPNLRAGMTPRRRFAILKRDKFRCQICGASAQETRRLEVDHKVAVTKGGSNREENLWTLCFECNRGKHNHDL